MVFLGDLSLAERANSSGIGSPKYSIIILRMQGNFLSLTQKLLMSNENPQHKEGPVASAIEEQTAKIPSDVFLWAAIGSMAVSAALQIAGGKHRSLFVGQWAAPFLL